MRKLRNCFLAILLSLIFVAAHPVGFLERLNWVLWPYLNKAGLDISMTPLTFDMITMYDPGEKLNIYKYKIEVIYRTHAGDKIIPLSSLSFYGFKVPAILFVEVYRAGNDTSSFIHALSYELKKRYGPGTEFMIHVDTQDKSVQRYGLNIFFPCF